MKRALVLVVIALAVSEVAWAQQGVSVKEKAVPFVTKETLTLRSSPPSGWFYTKGDPIGTVESGKWVIATEEMTVKTLFGEHKWLKVGVQDAPGGKTTAEGWMYVGDVGGKSYVAEKYGAKQ